MTVEELKEELDAFPDNYIVYIDTGEAVATFKIENPRKKSDKFMIMVEEDSKYKKG
jgi:hypothetical protein